MRWTDDRAQDQDVTDAAYITGAFVLQWGGGGHAANHASLFAIVASLRIAPLLCLAPLYVLLQDKLGRTGLHLTGQQVPLQRVRAT